MRELSGQLEDSLQQLVDAKLSLLESFDDRMTPEIHEVVGASIALGVQLETLYLSNEKQIAYIENILRESP
jgi:hypothetical protein